MEYIYLCALPAFNNIYFFCAQLAKTVIMDRILNHLVNLKHLIHLNTKSFHPIRKSSVVNIYIQEILQIVYLPNEHLQYILYIISQACFSVTWRYLLYSIKKFPDLFLIFMLIVLGNDKKSQSKNILILTFEIFNHKSAISKSKKIKSNMK